MGTHKRKGRTAKERRIERLAKQLRELVDRLPTARKRALREYLDEEQKAEGRRRKRKPASGNP
jgi:hypothetical protein